MVRQEYNLPLTKEAYEHLREKVDGRLIVKTRYEIPLDDRHKIELDIFHGDLAPLILAEVEFADEDEANQFTPPGWFGAVSYTHLLLSAHEIIALSIDTDHIQRLSGILRQNLIQSGTNLQNMLCSNLNLRCLSLRSARRLMNHNLRVRHCIPFTFGSS